MATLRFTVRAERDLLSISQYTIQLWGHRQADRYLSEMELCCARLAGSPSLGRRCENIRAGLRRFESAEHVIFYASSSTVFESPVFCINACYPPDISARVMTICRRTFESSAIFFRAT